MVSVTGRAYYGYEHSWGRSTNLLMERNLTISKRGIDSADVIAVVAVDSSRGLQTTTFL